MTILKKEWDTLIQYIYILLVVLMPLVSKGGNYIVPILLCFSLIVVNYTKSNLIKSVRLTDLGVFLVAFSALISLVFDVFNDYDLPSFSGYNNFFLIAGLYFSMCIALRGRNFNNQCINLVFSTFCLTIVYIFYITQLHGYVFSQLTLEFTYEKGVGSISQLAMYCSLYAVLIFQYKQLHLIRLSITAVGVIGVAFVLQSKLLFLVIILLALDQFAKKVKPEYRLAIFFTVCCIGLSLIIFPFWPEMRGRIDLATIAISNYNFWDLTGVGVGRFGHYINNVFFNQQAVNTVGEINDICFNDFVQVFIEMSYLGVAGLLVIFTGLMRGGSFFNILALFSVLFFAFPLQYPETMGLFTLTVYAFRNEDSRIFKIRLFDWAKLRLIYIAFFIIILIPYIVYNTIIHARWIVANEKIESRNKIDEGLSSYNDLSRFFEHNDKFLLQHGIHLSNNGQYNLALRELKKSNFLNKSYDSFAAIGDCYFQINAYQEAYQQYDLSRRLRPKFLYPRYRMIHCLIRIGKMEEAVILWKGIKGDFQHSKNLTIVVMITEIEMMLSQ